MQPHWRDQSPDGSAVPLPPGLVRRRGNRHPGWAVAHSSRERATPVDRSAPRVAAGSGKVHPAVAALRWAAQRPRMWWCPREDQVRADAASPGPWGEIAGRLAGGSRCLARRDRRAGHCDARRRRTRLRLSANAHRPPRIRGRSVSVEPRITSRSGDVGCRSAPRGLPDTADLVVGQRTGRSTVPVYSSMAWFGP